MSAALTLHAARITGWLARRELADRLQAVADTVGAEPHAFGAVPPLATAQIREAQDTLVEVAKRLRLTRPVNPRGVALLRLLLTDPAGPLHSPSDDGRLDQRLRVVLDLLDERP